MLDNLVPDPSFLYKRNVKKRAWNNSITKLKFSQIESTFFRTNYKIRGRRTENVSTITARSFDI